MSIGERLRRRRSELGMTLEEVAVLVGVTRATVQKYENGIIGNIPSDKIERLSAALRTTPAALMGWTEAAEAESAPAERENRPSRVARLYELANDHERQIIDTVLRPYEEQLERETKVVAFPRRPKQRGDGFAELDVYDQPSAAGLGNYLDVPVSQKQQYPIPSLPRGAAFGVLISGDSMEPRIHNGATVFVQPVPAVEHGEVGVFVLNGQAYCKQLRVDHQKREVRLHSFNSAYADMVIGEADELRTIGRVLGAYPE